MSTTSRRVHAEFRPTVELVTNPVPVIPELRTFPRAGAIALMVAPLIPLAACVAMIVQYALAGFP